MIDNNVKPEIIAAMKKTMNEKKTVKIVVEFVVITIVGNSVIPVQQIVKWDGEGFGYFQLRSMKGFPIHNIRTEKTLNDFFVNCGHLKSKAA